MQVAKIAESYLEACDINGAAAILEIFADLTGVSRIAAILKKTITD